MRKALIDSNFLCYRAKLTTGNLQYNGVRTGVMYGFFNQLMTIAEKLQPDQFLFFWDSRENKRKEIFPEYKMKRRQDQTEEEKEEWRVAFAQFKQLRKKILPRIGFTNCFIQKGYESDDLLAQYVMDNPHVIESEYSAEVDPLSIRNPRENFIITSDDDLLQLLDYCHIYNPAKDRITLRDDFVSAFKIEPSQWTEVKKIAGCTSDNVPGIEGVGVSTALKYLNGELKRTTKTYQNIINGKEVIERNHDLVVLPFKGTKEVKEEQAEFNMIEFLRLCREFGLNSFRHEEKKERIKQLFTTKGKENGNSKTKRRKKRSSEERSSEKSSSKKRSSEKGRKKRRSSGSD